MTTTDPVKHLTKLSDYETGESVWVELSRVTLVQRLPEVELSSGAMCAARTRLVLRGNPGECILVSETPNEIEQIAKEGKSNDAN